MRNANLELAVAKLPDGFYPHRLTSFINGEVALTKKKTIKLTIEINLDAMGSPYNDIRAITRPDDNQLVPLLVFVEPTVALGLTGSVQTGESA